MTLNENPVDGLGDTSGGVANAPRRAELPPVPPGHWRMPLEPLWWTDVGEIRGGLVAVELTEGPDAKPVQAVVIVVDEPTSAVDNWGERHAVGQGEPVRIADPIVLKLAPFTLDEEHVRRVVIHRVEDRGRRRLLVDVSNEAVSRAEFKPKLQVASSP